MLTRDTVWELQQVAYSNMAEQAAIMHELGKARPDGTPDWQHFHDAQSERCAGQLGKWSRILNELRAYWSAQGWVYPS